MYRTSNDFNLLNDAMSAANERKMKFKVTTNEAANLKKNEVFVSSFTLRYFLNCRCIKR
jgi:hypothetical protein